MTAPVCPPGGLQLLRAVLAEAAAEGQVPAHLLDLPLEADTRLDDLGLDSLGLAEIAHRLAEKTRSPLALEDLTSLATAGALATALDPARPPDHGRARFRQRNARFRNLRDRGAYPYHTPLARVEGSHVVTADGQRMLMLASYNYLGLSQHPRVQEAARDAARRYGQGVMGARLVSGTMDLHLRLESELARFTGSEQALVFSSGYVTNLATISALVGPGDVVLADEYAHASIHDGCRLSGAEVRTFRHEDLEDLRRRLQEASGRHVLVVVDAVYSMEGDVANVPAISALCREHGAMLMVDEAHSLGVLGATGRGIQEHFGLPPDAIDVKMGTLSKSLASVGGYVAGDADLIDYLRHHARGHIFSAALPPAQAAAALAALEILEAEPERVHRLEENARLWRDGLRERGLRLTATTTPIVPILIDSDEQALEASMGLRDKGIFVIPIVYPAVPVNAPRLRTTVTAEHTWDELKSAIEACDNIMTKSTRMEIPSPRTEGRS